MLGVAAGLGTIVVINLGASSESAGVPVVLLAGGAVAAFAVVLTSSRARIALLGVAMLGAITLTEIALPTPGALSSHGAAVIFGWLLMAMLGYWLSASVPRAARRISDSIGRAHRAERQASEIEAQRRQSARLLHDTVLATLTLLAHSGVGSPRPPCSSRRRMTRDCSASCGWERRRCRNPPEATTSRRSRKPLSERRSNPFKQRFGRMGLEVSWHGTGQVLLPSHVLDAFLLALAECLENVRRHAGVTEAHVTITDDETTVRAMVTDSGIGFDVKDVDSARLGLKTR